jgi:hypothetical protein
MKKALYLILAESGSAEELTFYIDDGVIEVTTLAIADSKMITKVYPVQDLLIEAIDYEAPNLNTLNNNNGSNFNNGNSNWNNNLWGNNGNNWNNNVNNNNGNNNLQQSRKDLQQSRKDLADKLIELITTIIRPDIWKQNGGNATIVIFQGNMIITAPRSVHEAVGGPIE